MLPRLRYRPHRTSQALSLIVQNWAGSRKKATSTGNGFARVCRRLVRNSGTVAGTNSGSAGLR